MPNYSIERAYKVRVFGRMFKDEYITALRNGFKMGGQQFGPYHVRKKKNLYLFLG